MKTKKAKKQIQKVGDAYRILAGENPEHKKALGSGLFIALSGGVLLATGGIPAWEVNAPGWTVNTPHTYFIRLQGQPPRWSCTCPQGASFGPIAGEFFGHPGRICKHVAAVGICLMAVEWPAAPVNLLGFLERVIEAGVGIPFGPANPKIPNGNGVRIFWIVPSENGQDALCLKQGRHQSQELAWRRDGKWVMDPEAGSRYRQWVETI